MLGHGHELHVRKAHFLHVRHQHRRHIAVGIKTLVVVGVGPAPGAKMHFVHGNRAFQAVLLPSFLHPRRIFPLIFQLRGDGSRFGPQFPAVGEGVALAEFFPGIGPDEVFVKLLLLHPGDKPFPDARFVPPGEQGMTVCIPPVEIPDYRHKSRIGRPHGEISTVFPFVGKPVGAELFVQPVVQPGLEQLYVPGRKQGERLYGLQFPEGFLVCGELFARMLGRHIWALGAFVQGKKIPANWRLRV